MRQLRRIPAAVFAGDRRVWRVAGLAALPLAAILAYYCLKPRLYYTGTNSTEAAGYILRTLPGQTLCVPGLEIPSETRSIELRPRTPGTVRPALALTLRLVDGRTIESRLPAVRDPTRTAYAEFPTGGLPARPAETAASLCLTSAGPISWAGTLLAGTPPRAPTLDGRSFDGQIGLWYRPAHGAQLSYLARMGRILRRAALFRPGGIGAWLYYLILLGVLPSLALLAVRCLALASASGTALRVRRMGAVLYAIAAVNFACWAVITPAFQAPDEVDHYAYTQLLAERGEAPSRNAASPRARWSSAEATLLQDMSFFTDHQVGDSRAPWSAAQQDAWRRQVAREHPSASDGGGNETAATHGVVYYAALVPAYLLATNSPLDQLTLMRLTSALIGALTVLFAFLLARELAPGRPWIWVLAALLVAFQPMYGFISGAVNNDVGVNAGAAALELVLIMILRRGLGWRLGLIAAALLAVVPFVKATFDALIPVAVIALLLALWRRHGRREAVGWGTLVVGFLAIGELVKRFDGHFHKPEPVTGAPAGAAGGSSVASEVLHHPLGYLGYLWQVFLPRLPFMTRHFETASPPFFLIYVERGWGAFGWYDVFYAHWVYELIFVAMIAFVALALFAARRERAFLRAHVPEAIVLLLMPLAVVAGAEAAFYTPGFRVAVAEFGRYAFPAIAPLAVLAVASLHALGRRWALPAGTALLVAMLALSYAGQLVTLTAFFS